MKSMRGLFFSAALLAAAQQAPAQVPDRIRLGVIVSVTGPGVATDLSMYKGVQLAVQEINKAGGIAGKPVEMVVGDSQSDPTNTVNETRRLIGPEHVQVIFGPVSSQLTLAVAPIMTQSRIFNVSASGTTELTPEKSPYGFSVIPPADVQARVMVDYAVDVLKAKSLAMIGDNGAQTKAAIGAAEAYSKQRSVKWLGVQEHQFRDTDMTPQMLNLRRAGPDVVLMWPNTGEDQALIVKARDDLGWKVPLVNGGGSGLLVVPAKKVYDKATDNIPSPMLKSWTYCQGEPAGSSELVKFKERLREFTGAEYPRLAPNYAAWSYDGIYAIKAAIEGAKSVDGAVLARWMEENSGSVKAVSGSFKASRQTRFLFSDPSSIVMVVDQDKPRSDGAYRRITGC
jgi:ABC-type branched-subunit amino acid transport system substrate-binding protein